MLSETFIPYYVSIVYALHCLYNNEIVEDMSGGVVGVMSKTLGDTSQANF
jgi:hypothetical protein